MAAHTKRKAKEGFYARIGKRVLDVLLAVGILLMFSWLYLFIMLVVAIKMGRPVFYGSERIGKGEKV